MQNLQQDLFTHYGLSEYIPKQSTDWRWHLADLKAVKQNGLKVFSCFACGGGSSMGYKLAGCEVIGCVELDKKVNEIYIKNLKPKFNFCMDIREFNNIPNADLPTELFNLDILDGSPPCTTFSMAGDRAENWGKAKKFREGQKEQTLDDLSFVFIQTVNKLKPKVVIMENVKGLLHGDAWAYVQRIYKEFNDAGYDILHWLVKGEKMGIPQKRHRVIFIAIKKDIGFDLQSLNMSFNYAPITYGQIRQGVGRAVNDYQKNILNNAVKGDRDFGDVLMRLENRYTGFTSDFFWNDDILGTITTKTNFNAEDKTYISTHEIINASTFPQDYDFINNSLVNVAYVCGMSVPPVMMKRIVERLLEKQDKIFNKGGVKKAC